MQGPPSPVAEAAIGPAPGLRAVLWLVPAVYFLFVAAEFVALTHLALTLTGRGASGLAVGTIASAFWVGILLASLRAHAAVDRLGHARTFVVATAVSTLAIATLPLHAVYAGWVGAAALLGLAGGLVWVSGEAWLAESAPKERRGFYVGLFESSVGLGMVTGPALLPLALALGWSPLHLASGLMLACLACSVRLLGVPAVRPEPVALDASGRPVAQADWRALAVPLIAVVAASGLMEAGISSLLPSISMRVGFELEAAAWLGAVIGAGSALLQSPFGLLADRIGLARAMALAWTIILATLLTLIGFADDPHQVLWPVGFLLGGVGGAVYTLVVIELGHRLAGSALVKAMGLLVTAYTLGTAGGPAAGGWLFDRAGLAGLALALLGCASIGAALAWRALRTARARTPAG
jgi:MFS family permease